MAKQAILADTSGDKLVNIKILFSYYRLLVVPIIPLKISE
jgi:hypothetical protein